MKLIAAMDNLNSKDLGKHDDFYSVLEMTNEWEGRILYKLKRSIARIYSNQS